MEMGNLNKRINWNCDFCGKSGLVVSRAGVIYCPYCYKTYVKENETQTPKIKEL